MTCPIMPGLTGETESRFRVLVAQYFQLVEPRDLRMLPGSSLKDLAVQDAIYKRMFDEAKLWPVPPVGYQTRVLKMILSSIEGAFSDPEEDEISDDLMRCWSKLIVQPKPSALQAAQQLSYIRYTAPITADDRGCRTVVTSESRGLILSSGTTGFRTWEAALHLGTFLSTPGGESIVRGKKIIELGAGTGFLSIYCAKYLGVDSALATDHERALILGIQDCVARNDINAVKLMPTIWKWGCPLSDNQGFLYHRLPNFDVALGADLIYDIDLVPPLVSTIRDLIDNYGLKEFILSVTLRSQKTFQTFLDACEISCLQANLVPFESPPLEEQTGFFHPTDVPIRIYKITCLSCS